MLGARTATTAHPLASIHARRLADGGARNCNAKTTFCPIFTLSIGRPSSLIIDQWTSPRGSMIPASGPMSMTRTPLARSALICASDSST